MLAISSDLQIFTLDPLETNRTIFQAVSQRRRHVFDELLAAYSASEKNVAKLKKKSDPQTVQIQELTGDNLPIDLSSRASFDCFRLLLPSDFAVLFP